MSHTTTAPTAAAPAGAVMLTAAELNHQGGIFCPSPQAQMKLWNTHPRVALNVAATGQAKCPYCGTVYALKPGEHVGGH